MSDFNFNSDDLSLDGDNDSPSKAKYIVGAIVAGVLLTICVNAGEEDPAPEPVAETAPAAIETVAEVEPEPEIEEEEVEVERDTSSSTGDYSSDSEYADEILDSTQKLGDAFGTWAEAADAASRGAISPSELAQLGRTFKTTLASHYDFFNTRTPPDRFRETNRLLLEALELYDESLDYAIECANEMKESACYKSAEIMSEANETIGRASATIN